MEYMLSHTVALLALAILTAILARRLRLPYTVGLVAAGAAVTFAHVDAGVELTHDIIFDAILPSLLFEAALNIHWSELRRDAAPVLTLAAGGVVISAIVVATGLTGFLGWPFASALVFGVLIAATDPIAVIAMFKDTGIKGRLRLLVESESLLNDGVAAVLFAIVVAFAQHTGEAASLVSAVTTLVVSTGGGVLTGLLCGGAAILVAGRTADYLVETALTLVAAYGSFFLAERLGMSGVLATVAAGLLMGNLGALGEAEKGLLSSRGREFVLAFWDFAAFIANSLIFLLIGLRVAGIEIQGFGWTRIFVIIALVLAGRALTVYPLSRLFRGSPQAIPLRKQHILWWGGLRGALSLGLALALPHTMPFRDNIIVAAFGVVAFSVVVQGLTMPLLLRVLGFTQTPA